MARNIHHIIDSTHKPDGTVIIELGTIAGKINSWKTRPVGFFIAFGLTPDTAQHRWPWLIKNEKTTMSISNFYTFVINNFRADTG